MKAVIVLVLLGGAVLGGMYLWGGYSTFDPDKQAETARAAIKPGMTLKQVVDVAGRNPKYQPINRFERKIGGHTVTEERPGTPVAFDYDRVTQRVKNGEVPNGFQLNYTYSQAKAFNVVFDAAGTVVEISDAATVADLFQSR